MSVPPDESNNHNNHDCCIPALFVPTQRLQELIDEIMRLAIGLWLHLFTLDCAKAVAAGQRYPSIRASILRIIKLTLELKTMSSQAPDTE